MRPHVWDAGLPPRDVGRDLEQSAGQEGRAPPGGKEGTIEKARGRKGKRGGEEPCVRGLEDERRRLGRDGPVADREFAKKANPYKKQTHHEVCRGARRREWGVID